MQQGEVNIPEGVTFGNKVLVLPCVLSAFSHSGVVSSNLPTNYVWVNRGDKIATFSVVTRKTNFPIIKWFAGTKAHSINILSPASGLVLHHMFEFGSPSVKNGRFAILLPENERASENSQWLFSRMCETCWEHRSTYFQPSRTWGMKAFEEDRFKELLEKQILQECQYLDVLPTYKDYLEEAMERHSNLTSYLYHIAYCKL